MRGGTGSCVELLRCVSCGRDYDLDGSYSTCVDCGPILGTFDVVYDLAALRAVFDAKTLGERTDPTIWRYHEILPIRDLESVVPLPVGMTPLYPLEADLGFKGPSRILVKDDTRNPSGSAKDRATALAMARAREIGAKGIAAASTGNAASSLAMFAARAGLDCFIFVPATAPPAKLIQIRVHGAILFSIEGSYDQAFDICTNVCIQMKLYNRNTAINPLLGEGKKTVALEIWEQLGYRAPDAVLIPVGDGCIIGGVAKGFRDLHDLGLITRVPRLVGVQAEGSAALADAWRNGRDRCEPVEPCSIADSICVSQPRDQVKALRAVRGSNGLFVTVNDEQILEAMSSLASRAGIFVEPSAAASLAGLKVAVAAGTIGSEEEVVLYLTGHGLKDTKSAGRAASGNESVSIKADLEAVVKVLAARRG